MQTYGVIELGSFAYSGGVSKTLLACIKRMHPSLACNNPSVNPRPFSARATPTVSSFTRPLSARAVGHAYRQPLSNLEGARVRPKTGGARMSGSVGAEVVRAVASQDHLTEDNFNVPVAGRQTTDKGRSNPITPWIEPTKVEKSTVADIPTPFRQQRRPQTAQVSARKSDEKAPFIPGINSYHDLFNLPAVSFEKFDYNFFLILKSNYLNMFLAELSWTGHSCDVRAGFHRSSRGGSSACNCSGSLLL